MKKYQHYKNFQDKFKYNTLILKDKLLPVKFNDDGSISSFSRDIFLTHRTYSNFVNNCGFTFTDNDIRRKIINSIFENLYTFGLAKVDNSKRTIFNCLDKTISKPYYRSVFEFENFYPCHYAGRINISKGFGSINFSNFLCIGHDKLYTKQTIEIRYSRENIVTSFLKLSYIFFDDSIMFNFYDKHSKKFKIKLINKYDFLHSDIFDDFIKDSIFNDIKECIYIATKHKLHIDDYSYKHREFLNFYVKWANERRFSQLSEQTFECDDRISIFEFEKRFNNLVSLIEMTEI